MLEIKGLTKHYGDFALNCSMKVERGCITGLVGENGAGKSTTFRCVLGLTSYEGGEITFMGKAPKDLSCEEKEKMGIVLTDAGFSEYLKVKDTVPILAAMYPKFDRSRFLNLCKKFGIPMDKPIREFSSGMKAKFKVITAVTHQAKFLLLDEPTSGLDVMAREGILNLLREYMEEDEDRSILISSHISTDLEGLCDDIYMIHAGEIILHDDTDVFLNEYGLIKADENQYAKLDKTYILAVRKEAYGYDCLTNERQYYRENYPDMTVENGSLDDVITMMIGGKRL